MTKDTETITKICMTLEQEIFMKVQLQMLCFQEKFMKSLF